MKVMSKRKVSQQGAYTVYEALDQYGTLLYRLHYSYKEIIAIEDHTTVPTPTTLIAKNEWSVTTAKHINLVSRDKDIRVPQDLILQYLEDSGVSV